MTKEELLAKTTPKERVKALLNHLALKWDMGLYEVTLAVKQNQKEGRPITEPRPYEEPELTEEMVNDPNYLYDYSNEEE